MQQRTMRDLRAVIIVKDNITNMWDKVFMNGPSKISRSCLSRPYLFKLFKGYAP